MPWLSSFLLTVSAAFSAVCVAGVGCERLMVWRRNNAWKEEG